MLALRTYPIAKLNIGSGIDHGPQRPEQMRKHTEDWYFSGNFMDLLRTGHIIIQMFVLFSQIGFNESFTLLLIRKVLRTVMKMWKFWIFIIKGPLQEMIG